MSYSNWKPVVMADYVCPKCKGWLEYRDYESSNGAHEDQQFRCTICKHSWWIDGIDS